MNERTPRIYVLTSANIRLTKPGYYIHAGANGSIYNLTPQDGAQNVKEQLIFHIINIRSTSNITLNPINGAKFYVNQAEMNSFILRPGKCITVICDGQYYYASFGEEPATLQQFVPVAGGTTTILQTFSPIINVIFNHTATISSGTITFPNLPFDGQIVRIVSKQEISTVTLSGGTFSPASNRVAPNSVMEFVYRGADSTWHRFSLPVRRRLDASKSTMLGLVGVCFGDSITNGSTAGQGLPYTTKLPTLIGTAMLSSIIVKGFPGEKSGDLLARYDADVATVRPDMVFLMVGTNDAANDVPLATYAANVIGIINKTKDAGIPIIIATVPPATTTGNSDARRILIYQYNTWIKIYCSQNNIPVGDVHAKLSNPATGDAAAGTYADLVHPNHLGHQGIAETLADTFVSAGLKVFNHLVTNVSVVNSVSNPLFLNNASPWYENPGGSGTAAVYSQKPASGLLKHGFWWEMDFNAIVGGTKDFCFAVDLAAKGLVAGDVVIVTAIMEIEDIAGGYYAGAIEAPATNGLRLRLMNQSFQTQATIAQNVGKSPGPIVSQFTIPSLMTSLIIDMNVVLATGQRAKFRIGEVGVFKVTGLPNITSLL